MVKARDLWDNRECITRSYYHGVGLWRALKEDMCEPQNSNEKERMSQALSYYRLHMSRQCRLGISSGHSGETRNPKTVTVGMSDDVSRTRYILSFLMYVWRVSRLSGMRKEYA